MQISSTSVLSVKAGTKPNDNSRKNMPLLTMLSAPSASGKSTKAVEMLKADGNAVRINRDDLRKMSIPKWTPKREKWVIAAEVALAKAAGHLKQNIIIDDTNLLPVDEARWVEVAQELGYQFKKVVLEVPLEECIRRDSLRGDKRIGRSAIERQFLRALLWKIPPCSHCLGDKWVGINKQDICPKCNGTGNKKTVIFDIDGTLADLTHRVPYITVGAVCPECAGEGAWVIETNNPVSVSNVDQLSTCCFCKGTGEIQKKDHDTFYSLVDFDEPIDIVIRWIQACKEEYHILIVSGRSPEVSEEGTIRWLAKHAIPYDHLLMRRANMHGPDDEEKQLILNMILTAIPKEDIAFVVDDRPNVVAMWKRNGLTVYPVRGRDDDKFYEIMNELEETHPVNLSTGE